MATFDSETRSALRRRRWRQPPPIRPARVLALVLVSVLHALFALAMWSAMQQQPPSRAVAPMDTGPMLVMHLLDHSNTPRAAQPPAPPMPPKLVPPRQVVAPRVRPVTHEKARPDAMVVQDHAVNPAPAGTVTTISLFEKDGSVRLPPVSATRWAKTSVKAKPPKPAGDRQIMQHDSNRMQYKATRFEKYFPPPNETAGGAVGRHIGNALKEIAEGMCDPTKKSTASNLLCGVPPIPPSPKDGDERLNLPPPPLTDDQQPVKPMPLATCIAEYNNTKPLSYGCPINTPDLAFKAEMRECVDLFRAGKRLKTWCPADTPKRAATESSKPAPSTTVGSR